MLAPPGTVERRDALALALRALKPGGRLTALAPKDKGGSRLAQGAGRRSAAPSRRPRAPHHRICADERPAPHRGLDAAIAAGAPRFVEEIGLWSQPGVFSWDRIDPGSRAAGRAPARRCPGAGADFGCGLGYLAHAVLASPKVDNPGPVDIDRRAVEAARRNVDDPRVTLPLGRRAQPSALTGLDFVVMNPPFHDGGTEDRALGKAFIRAAARSLRHGRACCAGRQPAPALRGRADAAVQARRAEGRGRRLQGLRGMK